MLRIEKEKRHFFRKQENTTKEYHCIIPGKYVNLCPPVIIQNTSISYAKRQIFNRAPNFVSVARLFTIQNTSNSQSKTDLRTSFLQNSSQWLLSQISVIFLERQKQKQFSTPPLCLIRLKSCNCIKIKILFIHKSEKTLIFVSYFKTSLITKELAKHENKFDRKVFHERENSENRFSEFSYFMKGFKEYIMNIYR